jgi:hypothetical protein
MPEDWSQEEVAATVADYFDMLGSELRTEAYNKKDHNRRLQNLLHNRSAGAIEFKHANISAVLLDLGFPYIDGYKPRANYQQLLMDEVVSRLDGDISLEDAAAAVVAAPASAPPLTRPLSDIVVPAPVRENNRTSERRLPVSAPRRGVNYLEQEARNRSLGYAGELFALELEDRRLREAGHHRLAARIEHVSQTKGDGLGYDILSFELNGRERLIEVKTTSFGAMTPFFVSRREVSTSAEQASRYSVCRIFKFRELPKAFFLPGSLGLSCVLDAVQYRATPGQPPD